MHYAIIVTKLVGSGGYAVDIERAETPYSMPWEGKAQPTDGEVIDVSDDVRITISDAIAQLGTFGFPAPQHKN